MIGLTLYDYAATFVLSLVVGTMMIGLCGAILTAWHGNPPRKEDEE